MAQLKTAPEINPTVVQHLPNQMLLVKQPRNIVDFSYTSIFSKISNINEVVQRLDWYSLSAKNKHISTVRWPLTNTNNWGNFLINNSFIYSLIPLGMENNSYSKFSVVLLTVRPTNNSMLAGLSLLNYFNFPALNFTQLLYNQTPNNPQFMYQYPHYEITPADTEEILIIIPLNFPFSFTKLNASSASGTPLRTLSEYHNNYVHGFINITPVVPLTTKTALTGLDFNVSGQIVDLSLFGVDIF
jgi:hypothetical protein